MDDFKLLEYTLMKYKKPAYKNSSQTHVSVRCPYCGDSKKSRSSAHFFIKTDEPPYLYHCKRCEAAGLLTTQTLRDLEIHSNDLSVLLAKSMKEGFKTSNRVRTVQDDLFSNTKEYSFDTFNTERAQKSREYLEERFGVDFSDEFIKKAKIVLDPVEFLDRKNYKLYSGSEFTY